MGVMKSISLDIAEISEKVFKELEERALKEFPGKPQAANSYMYLLLEGVGAELIRASADYKEE
jgi:hypothetical protein